MKKWLSAVLAALLLACFAASAEGFDFAFDDEGYTGEWVSLEGLDLQFCLPDGWAALEPELGAAFSAVSGDAAARLDVSLELEDVFSLKLWADENVPGWEAGEAGLYEAAVEETEDRLTIRLVDAGRLIAFRFDRASEEAMPRLFALQIAGSLSEDWGDDADYGEDEDGSAILAGEDDVPEGW